MGIGRSLVRGLGAAMQGYGMTLLQQDERVQKERESTALMNRQLALEEVKQRYRKDEISYQGAEQRLTNKANSADRIVETTAEVGVRSAAEAQKQERGAVIDANKDIREFGIWLKKQPVELQNKLTLEDFQQDRQDARTAYQEGEQGRRQQRGFEEGVVARGVDANGNVRVMKGNGSTTTFGGTKPNAVPSLSDPYGLSGPTAGPPPSGAGQPALRTKPAVKEQNFDEFNQILAQAANSARNRGRSSAELRAEVIELARSSGIAAPLR